MCIYLKGNYFEGCSGTPVLRGPFDVSAILRDAQLVQHV